MSEDAATRKLGKAALAETLPTSTATDELAFGQPIGRYLVLGVLGRGGMGIVYEAYDPELNRRIAVKRLREVIDDDASAGRARMQREAQAIARLSHANVITVHDVGEHGGSIYLAMELVGGGTLRTWQVGKAWREVVAAYLAAGRGLAAAHAAGLIHRDFKPDNVLLDTDGRIRVTDFGLARLARETDEAALPSNAALPATASAPLSSNLTAAGQVIGTPSYMAPEQIDGGTVDERSDQYAWCIALWEALFGEPPFVGGNLALRSAAMKTDTPKPPAATKVPRGVTRILLRGLLPEPAQRWPSMSALLDALERETTSRRVLIASLGAGALALVILVFAVGQHAGASKHCSRAGAPAQDLWSPASQRALAQRFAATGAPFAADAAASFGRAVTAWQQRWQRTAIASCEATRVQGSQSEATLDLRTACLMRSHDALRTRLAAIGGDRKSVEDAATVALPDLDACDDVTALAGATPLPRDRRARVALETRLDALERVIASHLAIEPTRRLVPEVEAQLVAAQALGYLPLVVRARRDLAELAIQLGDGKRARQALTAAAADAAAAGEPDAQVELYAQLADVEARLTSEFALAEGWIALAGGTLARLGPRPAKQLAVARMRGVIAQRAGRAEDARAAYAAELALASALSPKDELRALNDLGFAETDLGELKAAQTHLDRARTLARIELGEHHPRYAQIEHNLAVVAYREGRYVEAEQLMRNALAIRAAAYGTDSVDYAQTLEAIGNAEVMLDKVADARKHFAQAIEILEARLGRTHPDVANAYNDIGSTYHRAGLHEQAFANQQHVLALREAALGPDHPDVAQSLVNLAIDAKNLKRWELIDPSYQRALALFTKAYGARSVEVGITYINLGEAKRAQGLLDAAAAAYEKARVILAEKLGESHPILAHVWNGEGQLELARGHLDQAVPLLVRAVAVREKEGGDATDLAESRFALAMALAAPDGPTDRKRAIVLATAAREAYREAGPGYADKLAAVEAWFAHLR